MLPRSAGRLGEFSFGSRPAKSHAREKAHRASVGPPAPDQLCQQFRLGLRQRLARTSGCTPFARHLCIFHVDPCCGGSPAPRCADLAEASSWRTSADSGRAMNNQSAPKKTP